MVVINTIKINPQSGSIMEYDALWMNSWDAFNLSRKTS